MSPSLSVAHAHDADFQKEYHKIVKSSPAPPDPVATAGAQGAQNLAAIIKSAQLNRTSQVGPTGSSVWSNPDENGVPTTQTTSLSPDQQALYNQRNSVAGDMLGAAQGLADSGQLGFDVRNLPQINTNFSDTAKQAQDTTFQREMGLLEPVQQAQQRDLNDNLSVRGLPRSSEGGAFELNRLGTQQNEQQLKAAQDAVAAGNALQQQQFGQSVTAQNQAITADTLPYQLMMQLAGGAPTAPAPGGQNPAQYQVSPPDLMGATQQNYAAQSNNAAANNAAAGAATSAIVSALASY